MKFAIVTLSFSFSFRLSIASEAHPNGNTTLQGITGFPPDSTVLLDERYPDSSFVPTPNTPQMLCGDTKNLTVVANEINPNVTIRNCEALRDADGNGYWNFTFDASDRNDTGGLAQFTVNFDGDCEVKFGLLDYMGVPFNVEIGNTDIYKLINMAISGGNFSKTTGQMGCNDDVQVVWAVEWIPGGIGR
ncbi:hypothetical protein VP1G_07024 [Cytospora mali]|uniref:Ecp2 effector protein domain-containing protein n=1 Tax=Cytospora mali TaxID=578113 RepID=A0A194V799_CYTMA|nr:hypothetical protein VP1G_07024 [Valsa mali var. pyri (nom. inval.)]